MGNGVVNNPKKLPTSFMDGPLQLFHFGLIHEIFFLYLFILRFDKSTEVQYLIDKSLLKHNCLKGLDFEYRTSKFGCMESITCF